MASGSPVPRRRMFWTTQCLSLLIGRDSSMITVSPIWHRSDSSWALKLRVRRSVRPYSRWRVTSSTATTTVLFILLLVTRPTLVRRGLRVSGMAERAQFLLSLQRSHAGDVPPHDANARRVGQLSRCELKSELEQLFVQFVQPHLRIRDRLFFGFG